MNHVLVGVCAFVAIVVIVVLAVYLEDPSVRWGGLDVGGIRVSHLSHLDKPLTVALTVTRGTRKPYTVQPLTDAAPAWTAAVAAASTEDELRAVWKRFAADTDDDGRAALTLAMTARRSELQTDEGELP